MRAYQYFPRAEVTALYAAGRSLRQIGTTLGVTHNTVKRWLEWAGVALRPRGGANRARLHIDTV